MEEADILGDRIGIMCKGRLRCIGNSVRLKSRYGEGYKVSVSCGDNMKPDSASCKAVKSFFKEQLGISCVEETKAYMHFSVPVEFAGKMAQFFADLDKDKAALGVVDVQLSMSTLEDVFLKVATKSEFEDAQKESRTVVVTLKSGENVAVRVGCEEALTAESGATFTVKWGTDEDGRLIPVDTKEMEMQEQEVMVTCPPGLSEGQAVQVMVDEVAYQVAVPPGVSEGQAFKVSVRVPKLAGAVSQEDMNASQYVISAEEVQGRVDKLHTPFLAQADALFRKNLSFQWKRRVTNCCLVLVPLFVLALVFGIQALLEVLFLGTPLIRCPYCGPADDSYGQLYCNKASSCANFFFPNSSRQDYINVYGTDVSARCAAIAGEGPLGKNDPAYCKGNGNPSCFQIQWASVSQVGFCPYLPSAIPTQPPIGSAPLAQSRSDTPVLFTSDAGSKGFANLVSGKSAATKPDTQTKYAGAVSETNRQLFQIFAAAPLVGCREANSTVESLLPSVCRLLASTGDSADVCCVDLTGPKNPMDQPGLGLSDWQSGNFKGQLAMGVNYWTDMPDVHNDLAYSALFSVCNQTSSPGACNKQIMQGWVQSTRPAGKYGVRFGTGKGQMISGFEIAHLMMISGMPMQLQNLIQRELDRQVGSAESFRCIAPAFATQSSATMADKYPKGTCINIEEGLAVLAKINKAPISVHPINDNEPGDIPQCSPTPCTFSKISDPVLGTLFADTPGRWAQICDFYTQYMPQSLAGFQAKCAQEGSPCPAADNALRAYLTGIPCMCRWTYFARAYVSTTVFPAGFAAAGLFQLPRTYQCRVLADGTQDCSPSNPMSDPAGSKKPAALSSSACWRRHYHAYSMPEIKYVTSIWPGNAFYSEPALEPSKLDWWNQKHVLTGDEKKKFDQDHASDKPTSCQDSGDCWLRAAFGHANISFLALDCSAVPELSCFLQKMGNLTGIGVGCISTSPKFVDDASQINTALYNGQYSKYGSTLAPKEYIGAYNLHNSAPGLLNASVLYNDTTQIILGYTPNPTPPSVRLSEPINAIVDAFLNLGTDASTRVYASLMGLREVRDIGPRLGGGARAPCRLPGRPV